MSISRINEQLSRLLANFRSFDLDPLDNSQRMDSFSKYQLFSTVKHGCSWIAMKVVQEHDRSLVSAVSFADDCDLNQDILDALVDERDNSFQRKGVITKEYKDAAFASDDDE